MAYNFRLDLGPDLEPFKVVFSLLIDAPLPSVS